MKVSEYMTLDVETVAPEASVQEAAQLMSQLDIGVLPVNDGGRLVGIITDRDIAIRAVAQGKDPNTTLVSELMSGGVEAIHDYEDVDEVAEKMADLQLRRLPVIDEDDRLAGIITLADIARERRPRKAGEVLQGISRPGGLHNA